MEWKHRAEEILLGMGVFATFSLIWLMALFLENVAFMLIGLFLSFVIIRIYALWVVAERKNREYEKNKGKK